LTNTEIEILSASKHIGLDKLLPVEREKAVATWPFLFFQLKFPQ